MCWLYFSSHSAFQLVSFSDTLAVSYATPVVHHMYGIEWALPGS